MTGFLQAKKRTVKIPSENAQLRLGNPCQNSIHEHTKLGVVAKIRLSCKVIILDYTTTISKALNKTINVSVKIVIRAGINA
jgi:hypothetical protein